MKQTIQITNKLLVEAKGATEPWWNRRRAKMVEAGVLHKVGRKFFGALEDVDAWLRGETIGTAKTGGWSAMSGAPERESWK